MNKSKLESLSEAGSVMLIGLKAIKPSYRLILFAGTPHTYKHTKQQDIQCIHVCSCEVGRNVQYNNHEMACTVNALKSEWTTFLSG